MANKKPARAKRERSARYPGVPLDDAIDFCRLIDERGLDGLSAGEIAEALGYKNLKTNTFSARLSAARQFGLLVLHAEGYRLSPLCRSILHPAEPAEVPQLYRQAFLTPPLYAELVRRLGGKRAPDAAVLANLLYHNHKITASAKQAAAESFLESARLAGALRTDGTFDVGIAAPLTPTSAAKPRSAPSAVRIDLRLWGADQGKVIRVRAPESITAASLERLLQALRLHLHIETKSKEPDS
jgi:hypothetical protein